MMEKIINELKKEEKVRENLKKLRDLIKDEKKKEVYRKYLEEEVCIFEDFLAVEDAKTRKNAVLLLGEIGDKESRKIIWEAYQKEETLFVRADYLEALHCFEMKEFLPQIKEQEKAILSLKFTDEERKHRTEEIRKLRSLIIKEEGVQKHRFIGWKEKNEMIVLANRKHLSFLLEEIEKLPEVYLESKKMMNAGIRVKTDGLKEIMKIRTFNEILFLIPGLKTCVKDPVEAAKQAAESGLLEFLQKRHEGEAPFFFRVEVKSESIDKSVFIKKFVNRLETETNYRLSNSPSAYEVELRFVENKEGKFNVMVKLYTIDDKRFIYRKEVISSSIRPVNAALLVNLSEEYMSEEARVLDPFCGVGTMLIERLKRKTAKAVYGLDYLEEAVEKARRNTEEAGKMIHYVNRDFFTFTHEYLFDEIFTNMPFAQGKKTPLEIYTVYEKFFDYLPTVLKKEGVIILYTHDKKYVEKCVDPRKYLLLKKEVINVKEDTWLYVFRRK